MSIRWGFGRTCAVVAALALTLAGCTGYGSTSQPNRAVASCPDVLDSALGHVRTDDNSSQTNNEFAWLSDNCRAAYEVLTDYQSALITTGVTGVDTCESWAQYIGSDAIALLREDGLCIDGDLDTQAAGTWRVGEVDTQPAATWPEGGLGWDAARDQAGTTQRVCGPLMSLRNTEDGAFLNLGIDYPSTDRFTFIIWGAAVEPIEEGATICGSGSIYLYDGVAQVELGSAEAIEIWR